MNTVQLQEYITKALSAGSSVEQIKQTLLAAGWQLPVIEPIIAQLTQTTPQTSPQNADSSSSTPIQQTTQPIKQGMTTIVKIALVLLGTGIILILVYMFLMSVGKSIYHSPKTPFSQKETSSEQFIGLTTKDNPYRTYLSARYTVKGKPFQSHTKLFDYSVMITDSQGEQIITNGGTYEHSESSSDSDKKTLLSIGNETIFLPLKDFQIAKNDTVKLSLIIAVPDSLASNFTLTDWDLEIKGQVLKPSPLFIAAGAICIVISALLLLLFGRKSKSK